MTYSPISGGRWFVNLSLVAIFIVGYLVAISQLIDSGATQNSIASQPNYSAHLILNKDGNSSPEVGYTWAHPNDPNDLAVIPIATDRQPAIPDWSLRPWFNNNRRRSRRWICHPIN